MLHVVFLEALPASRFMCFSCRTAICRCVSRRATAGRLPCRAGKLLKAAFYPHFDGWGPPLKRRSKCMGSQDGAAVVSR
jgi:hypothetical protein